MDNEEFYYLGYQVDDLQLSLWDKKVKENILNFRLSATLLSRTGVIPNFDIPEEYRRRLKILEENKIQYIHYAAYASLTNEDKLHYAANLASDVYPDNNKVVGRLYYAAWMNKGEAKPVDREFVEGDSPLPELIPHMDSETAAYKLIRGADSGALTSAYQKIWDYQEALTANPKFIETRARIEKYYQSGKANPQILQKVNEFISATTIRRAIKEVHPESSSQVAGVPKEILLQLFPDIAMLGPAASEILDTTAEIFMLYVHKSKTARGYQEWDKTLRRMKTLSTTFGYSVQKQLKHTDWLRHPSTFGALVSPEFKDFYQLKSVEAQILATAASNAAVCHNVLSLKRADSVKRYAETYLKELSSVMESQRLMFHDRKASTREIKAARLNDFLLP